MTNPQRSWGSVTRFERVTRSLAGVALMLGAAAVTPAGTLDGSVKNGTSQRALSGTEVVLMELEQGMTPVGKVKTDSQGRFHFRNVALGKGPMLLEAAYQGVPYYQTLPAGEKTATIVVYDTTANRDSVAVSSHTLMLKPNGSDLEVEEQYIVENQSQPPVAFYIQGGTFAFLIPENAQLGQVFAWTVGNIPTRQNTMELAKDRKVIDWPFRPGKSVVRIFYAVPYPSNQASLRSKSPYPAAQVLLAVPPGVHVLSDGFTSVGSQQGFDVYARQFVAADVPLAIAVSGASATLPASKGENPSTPGEQTAVSTLPERYHKLVWVLGAAIAVLLGVGTLFFWHGSAAQAKQPASAAGKRKGRAAPHLAAELEENLDRVKKEFLELKRNRQGGAISEQDYARERERAEQTLREILRD
ncbi:MAG TPA: hypothetical protein VEJ67_15815 [Candidatus Cybelea sp.]|nr:hypothetical protein [Candidatus Cybelea sp.]